MYTGYKVHSALVTVDAAPPNLLCVLSKDALPQCLHSVLSLTFSHGEGISLAPPPTRRHTWTSGVGNLPGLTATPLGQRIAAHLSAHPSLLCHLPSLTAAQATKLNRTRIERRGTGRTHFTGNQDDPLPSLSPPPPPPRAAGGADTRGEGSAVGPCPQLHTKPFTFSLPSQLLPGLRFSEGLGCPFRWSAGRSDSLS